MRRGAVKALRNRFYEQVLDCGPVIDYLEVPHSDDRVSEQSELGVVLVVAGPLRSDVSAAVDLEYEAIPEQEIDAMSRDPGLRDAPDAKPLGAQPYIGFEP